MLSTDLLNLMKDVEKWFDDDRYASTSSKIEMMISRRYDFEGISNFCKVQPELRESVRIYNGLINRLNQEIVDEGYQVPKHQWIPESIDI